MAPAGFGPSPVRLAIWLGAVALLAVAALVAAAVIPGSHHSEADPAVAQRAVAGAGNVQADAAARVDEGVRLPVPANRSAPGRRSERTGRRDGRPVSDLSPVPVVGV